MELPTVNSAVSMMQNPGPYGTVKFQYSKTRDSNKKTYCGPRSVITVVEAKKSSAPIPYMIYAGIFADYSDLPVYVASWYLSKAVFET